MVMSPCAGQSTRPRKNASLVTSRIASRNPRMWTTNWKFKSSRAATTNSVNIKQNQTKKENYYVKKICILHRHLAQPGGSNCRATQKREFFQQRHFGIVR